MSSDSTTVTTPPPAKFSRYRSVRNAGTGRLPATTASVGSGDVDGEDKSDQGSAVAVSRSRSRYRQRAPSTSRDRRNGPPANDAPLTTVVPPLPPVPAVPQQFAPQQAVRGTKALSPTPPKVEARHDTPGRQARTPVRGEHTGRTHSKSVERQKYRAPSQEHRGRQERSTSRRPSSPRGRKSAEQVLEEQKHQDLKRLERELEAAQKKRALARDALPTVEKPRTLKKRPQAVNHDDRPRTDVPSTTISSGPRPRPTASEAPKPVTVNKAGIDAPISAVNAGERRVLVRCKQSSINLPITPTTTAVDLIYSSANVLSQSVAPSASVLVESYTRLGLERRIRRYEHVRDVMNSWDRDTQNALLLKPSDSPRHDSDLDASSVKKKIPPGVTVHMYHSQKAGKWNKRYITLMPTGQIYMSKHAEAKPSDKDVVTLCHLTDFDVYSVGSLQAMKNIRPPKRHCHAIKSQQKTAMFLSTDDYVHFFSTDDETLSETWYDAVQSWRSWYLIHVKGTGGTDHTAQKSGHEEAKPYTIGTFSSFMDNKIQAFTTGGNEIDEEDENLPRQIPFHLRNSVLLTAPLLPPPVEDHPRRHPPPVALNRRSSPGLRLAPRDPTSRSPAVSPAASPLNAAFPSKSLLGRTYTQRKEAQKSRTENTLPEGPFVTGPSLLNSLNLPSPTFSLGRIGMTADPPDAALNTATISGPKDPADARSSAEIHNANMPAPLLEFRADSIPILPHRRSESKGKGVRPPSGTLLVEAATGQKDMI